MVKKPAKILSNPSEKPFELEKMVGKTISHYKILERLGEGGMGVVYKAEDTKLKRTVALKFISPLALENKEKKTRFVREAQAAASLDHPNICTIYEIDEAEGQTFIAMAYIKGQNLKQKIESAPLKLEEAIDIAAQVVEGLDEAHEKGIVHRDIKSSNIMITEKNQAKIMDFGLAKLTQRTRLTATASIMGTVAYMSPEQASGNLVDHRTDIWSFGVVLYEMLTGQMPFQAAHDQVVLYSILNKYPKPITSLRTGIPLEVEAIVNKCLEKEPSERYQTAADLKADLKRLKRDMSAGKTSLPVQTTAASRPLPKYLRSTVFPILGVILVLLLVLALPPTRRVLENWLGLELIPTEKNLAVLPFTIVGGGSSDQAFCSGLVETLTSKLIRVEQFQKSLWVLPTHEVYKFEITSSSKARRVFRINLALRGSFKRIGDMFSLTLNLIDTKTMRQLKSHSIADHIANISTLQEDVVIRLLEMLEIEVQPQIRSVLTVGKTTIPGAFESYLQGVGYMPFEKKEGNLDSSIRMFKQAAEKDPHYALAYAGMGKAYWEKYKETKDPALIEKAQSSSMRAIEINDRLSFPYVMLGIIYGKTGRHEEAIEELQQALKLDPENFRALKELGLIYEYLGRLDEAEKTYKKIIDLMPNYWAGYSCLGYLYYYQGRYNEAERMYRQSTTLMTENVLDYNNLMAIYYQLGQYESVRAAFERSIAIEPNADAYSNMGTTYFYQRRYADALVMYEEAIELGEDYYVIWANLADSYRYAPGYKERAPEAYQRAIQLAEEELKIDPGNAHLRSSLAVIHSKVEDHENALAEISKAKNQAPNNVPIIFNCILVYELINQREKALQALQEYIKLGGSIEEVRNHPDLSGLRTDSQYKKLVKEK